MQQYKQTKTFKTHLGEAKQISIKRKYFVRGEDEKGKHLADNRKTLETRYEGLQINRVHTFKTKTEFKLRDIIIRNGKIQKYIGSQDDIVNDNLETKVSLVSSVSGRDKQVKNKVCKGELRRKRVENNMLSFGISKPKKYHKNKHK